MSTRSVILDEEHFRVVEDKARALGTTTDQFVVRLIEAEQALETVSFDQLLAPIRQGFEPLSDEDLDSLLADAKHRVTDSKEK